MMKKRLVEVENPVKKAGLFIPPLPRPGPLPPAPSAAGTVGCTARPATGTPPDFLQDLDGKRQPFPTVSKKSRLLVISSLLSYVLRWSGGGSFTVTLRPCLRRHLFSPGRAACQASRHPCPFSPGRAACQVSRHLCPFSPCRLA
jgi:hypothetical protein